ncbi:MAG: histidine kinase [Betaproteobacteria bacterium]|nr:histidine kinase [Betaproteobacteria bacterium]
MFKAFGNFIHRTPWWAMILLGISTFLLLVVFSTPVHVMRLSDAGATPEERRAIKREIDRAFGDSALNVAENIVGAIKERSNDPVRRQEMERALSEIAQARKEIFAAQRDGTAAAREAMREAQANALEAAREAAEAAVEAAREAREAVEEAKSEALDKLKASGADTAAAAKAFDDTIKTAREKEKAARDAVKKITDTKRRGLSIGINTDEGFKLDIEPSDGDKPAVKIIIDEGEKKKSGISPPSPPAAPGAPGKLGTPGKPGTPSAPGAPGKPGKADADKGVTFDGTIGGTRVKGNIDIGEDGKVAINLPPLAPTAPLPPQLREDIHAKVASDVYRIGVGGAMLLAFIPIFIMLLIAKYFIDRSRRATAFAEEKKKEAEVSDVNRQITEARLQALQAQVEPHFLYNTLANVQALTEVDPAQANQMTGHLIQYLRSSLPKMRENTSTIGQEIELVRAYLNILKMRMGERLAFDIDCPADMNSISFPPLMLPSLVENAIKHGLEPQREGGRIDVVVSRVFTAAGDRIRVAVKDTGRGLTDAPVQAGGGVGLSNIRERLIALYGDQGKLTLESNEPKGVVATIEIPAEAGGMRGDTIPSASPAAGVKVAPPPAPKGWWGRTRHAIATTHGVWAKIMSVTFVTLMIALAVIFGLALAGLYTGMLPINVGNAKLGGFEGMALGTIGLLVAFGAVALVLAIVVALLYGLGLFFAGLLIVIPLIVLISVFPALAPFVLIGLAIYWFWWRKRDKTETRSGNV